MYQNKLFFSKDNNLYVYLQKDRRIKMEFPEKIITGISNYLQIFAILIFAVVYLFKNWQSDKIKAENDARVKKDLQDRNEKFATDLLEKIETILNRNSDDSEKYCSVRLDGNVREIEILSLEKYSGIKESIISIQGTLKSLLQEFLNVAEQKKGDFFERVREEVNVIVSNSSKIFKNSEVLIKSFLNLEANVLSNLSSFAEKEFSVSIKQAEVVLKVFFINSKYHLEQEFLKLSKSNLSLERKLSRWEIEVTNRWTSDMRNINLFLYFGEKLGKIVMREAHRIEIIKQGCEVLKNSSESEIFLSDYFSKFLQHSENELLYFNATKHGEKWQM